MSIHATAIGTIAEQVQGTDKSRWKIRVHETIVTGFSKDDPVQARRSYTVGDRIRLEGTPNWNEFNNEHSLTIGNAAVDLTDQEDDELKGRVEGSFDHELKIEHDDDGKFVNVKLVCPVRKPVKANGRTEWIDADDIVLVRAEGSCVDRLLKLQGDDVQDFAFSGYLSENAEYTEGSDDPGYYMEAEVVEEANQRTEKAFWGAPSRWLKNRKTKRAPARKLTKKGGGEGDDKDFDDQMPF